jgi:hypothetical protein
MNLDDVRKEVPRLPNTVDPGNKGLTDGREWPDEPMTSFPDFFEYLLYTAVKENSPELRILFMDYIYMDPAALGKVSRAFKDANPQINWGTNG